MAANYIFRRIRTGPMKNKYYIKYVLTFLLIFLPATTFAASVTLRWQANSEPDIASYNVYYGMETRTYGPPRPFGNVTSATVDNLTEGLTYFFSLTAVDTSGNESGYSYEVSAQATSSVPPVDPFNIVVSTRSDHANEIPLSNQTISGDVYIFIQPDAYISQVVFSIDGSTQNTENYAPYNFGNSPYNSATLSNGTHTISARITDQNGDIQNISATFTVSNSDSGGTGSSTNPPQAVTLGANSASPVEGQSVVLQGTVEGGDSNTEYLFSYRNKKKTIYGMKWKKWAVLRDWSSASSFTWNTLDTKGAYQLKINARNPADPGGNLVTDTMSMNIQENRPDAVTLNTNRPSPQQQGTWISVSGNATGGIGSHEYKFMYRKTTALSKGKWITLQDWSSSSGTSWNTDGLKGKFQLYVGARNAGSQASASTSQKVTFKINR